MARILLRESYTMPQINYFRGLEADDVPAGQVIFDIGDAGDLMYAVEEGEVEIMVHDRLMETVGAGGFFGEMAIVDASPRSAKAIAKTDCKIISVNKDKFLFLVHQTPTFALQVMHTMADRLRHMNELV